MATKLTTLFHRIGYCATFFCFVGLVYNAFGPVTTLPPTVTGQLLHTFMYACFGISMYMAFMPLEKQIHEEWDGVVHLSSAFTTMLMVLFLAGLSVAATLEGLDYLLCHDSNRIVFIADALGLIVGFAFAYLLQGFFSTLVNHFS